MNITESIFLDVRLHHEGTKGTKDTKKMGRTPLTKPFGDLRRPVQECLIFFFVSFVPFVPSW